MKNEAIIITGEGDGYANCDGDGERNCANCGDPIGDGERNCCVTCNENGW